MRRFGGLVRLAGYLRPYWRQALIAGIALIVAAGSVLGIGQGLRLVIDQGLASGTGATLDRALLVTAGVVLVLSVAAALRFYWVMWIGERVAADLRRDVFERLLELDPGFYLRNGVGEIQSRMTTDTALLQSVLGSTFSMALRNALLLAGTLIMLVVTQPALSALVIAGIPIVLAPMLIVGRRVRRLSRLSQDRIADVGSYAGETLGGIETVQAFVHEPVDRRVFGDRVEEAFAIAVRRIRQRAGLNAVALLLAFSGVAFVLWRGGSAVIAGAMSAGELSAFLFYAVLAAGAVGVLSEVAGELFRASGAAERLFELLDAEPAIQSPNHPITLPVPARGEVVLEAVAFRYPTRPEPPALTGVDLVVHAGETLALVGPSGAGKSTLISLLLRFHDPSSGRITLDGVDLRDADPAAVRQRMALVAQEPVLFTGTVADNIRFGNPSAERDRIVDAAKAANCQGFVDALPAGLDTDIGPGGVQLSGGQRQRIAIARAILRDPALLLLDEATSSLDAESEQQVQTALTRLMTHRTSVVIAHRLATVRNADRIAVLETGTVRAIGTHDQLMATDDLYAHLAALQFQAG
ncbi:ABC transporter transmembrane domain-containing protein [Spiribacter vilamensis]|uniref:ATP-binding cassette subfamily B protein n=1 Tax=Spiribacter vilamensis TaxID=531306 RepID=A0A4Q8CZ64_9GAMM|nr:ABC transporter transmembrane domain-containing protein [Spiribacter vilamensis]RZU98293.1 ATP-binding cassette subfamily B protein [Spiribacter vilamensis]TVO60815.1 ATP-binding cassette domain-containing protein [Spiribacter vilamensis]